MLLYFYMKRNKRNLIQILDDFYKYMSTHDEVLLNEIRENVVSSPSDRHLLSLISNIQPKPFLYIKEVGKKKVILKLSTHDRDPHIRYIQLKDIIKENEDRRDKLKKEHNQAKEKSDIEKIREYGLLLERYRDLVDTLLKEMVMLRDREKVLSF
jgi:hypothetical protein